MQPIASNSRRWSTGAHNGQECPVTEGDRTMTETAMSPRITDRMMRAARLEVPLYEEVEADTTATNQALMVVVIVAVASGIGAAIGASPSTLVPRLIGILINGLISWAVWSYVV